MVLVCSKQSLDYHADTCSEEPPSEPLPCVLKQTMCVLSGCKMNNINVVYTPWANLKKTGDMDVGQIGFHRQKEVSRTENASCSL